MTGSTSKIDTGQHWVTQTECVKVKYRLQIYRCECEATDRCTRPAIFFLFYSFFSDSPDQGLKNHNTEMIKMSKHDGS